MAKRRPRKSDGAEGIYRRGNQARSPEEWEAVIAKAKKAVRSPNPLDRVGHALRLLHEAAHDANPQWRKYASGAHGLTTADVDCPDVQEDATLAWQLYCQVSRFAEMYLQPEIVNQTKLFEFLGSTLRLGRMLERLHVRAFETAVRESNSRKPGERLAAEIVNAAHVELQGRYQSRIDELLKLGGISFTAASEKVAKEFGVSGRTVRRYSRNPNTKASHRDQ